MKKFALILVASMPLMFLLMAGSSPLPIEENISLKKIMDSLRLKPKDINVLVDKSDYRLYIRKGDQVLKEYPIVLGGNPTDDKLREGDMCTPEGTFHMISKYPHKEWSYFIWFDYPNATSWTKHKAAKANGTIPKTAKIGGEVGIHGVPKGYDHMIEEQYNWTLGCVSLTTDGIKEIYPYIEKETDIIIRK